MPLLSSRPPRAVALAAVSNVLAPLYLVLFFNYAAPARNIQSVPSPTSVAFSSLHKLQIRSSTELLNLRGSAKPSRSSSFSLSVVRLCARIKHTAAIPASSHNAFGSLSHLVIREVLQRTSATNTKKPWAKHFIPALLSPSRTQWRSRCWTTVRTG